MLEQYSQELRWSYLGSVCICVLQVASTAVMARLLTPADFGIMALIVVLYRFMNYFAQFGVGRALVQKKTIEPDDVRGALTLAITFGVAFSILMLAGAPLFARYFRQAHATGAIQLYALNFLLQAFAITPMALLRRQFRMKRLAVIETVAFASGQFAFGFPAAYFGAGYWAIIFSTLAQSLVLAAAAYASVQHSLWPLFDLRRYQEILNFGGKISGMNIVFCLSASADTFALGRLVSATSLGLYNRSFTIINWPLQYFSDGLQKVMGSAMSREQHDLPRLRHLVANATRSFSAIVIPVGTAAAFSAHSIVFTILGGQWSETIPIFRWICLGAVLGCLTHIPHYQAEAMGRFSGMTVVEIGVLFGTVTGVYLGAKFGIVMVAMAIAIVQGFRCLGMLSVSTRLLKCSPLDVIREWIPGTGAGVLVGAAAFLVEQFGSALPPVARLAIATAACSCVLIGYYRFVHPQTVLLPLSVMFGSRIEQYVRRILGVQASVGSV
jgi:O-antigen/teichoic acid export membrane protein